MDAFSEELLISSGSRIIRRSLDFDAASSQYLSMSNANWGSYNRTVFGIAGSIYIDDLSVSRAIITRDASGVANVELSLQVSSSGNLLFGSRRADGDVLADISSGAGVITAGAWYAFLITANLAASNPNRVSMWINNTQYGSSTGTLSSLQSLAVDTKIGREFTAGVFDGRIYSLAFFSGSVPTPAQVFRDSSGKIKNLRTLPGLHSLLDVELGDVTSDYVLSSAWTNNNGVTAIKDKP